LCGVAAGTNRSLHGQPVRFPLEPLCQISVSSLIPLPCPDVVQTLLRGFDQLHDNARGGAISIGNFDGVHWGHAALVRQLRQTADRLAGPAVVITFDPHPAALLRPNAPLPRLTTLERRAELLARLGVDFVVVCEVTQPFLNLTAQQFFQTTVQEALQARAVVEGPNFFFGRNREGDIERLREMCAATAIELHVVQPETRSPTTLAVASASPRAAAPPMISSSRIRTLLANGDVSTANSLLTAPYQLTGVVGRGEQRGRGLGFPTANLRHTATMIPGHGVYATRVNVNGQTYPAATHLGPNPTFGGDVDKVEVHILNFNGDLYGRSLSVDFVAHVRDIASFKSIHELKQQLQRDVALVKTLVANAAPQ